MTNIKDLAKLAGVSVTTVSRVLNKHPYVSQEKREAVLDAIRKTNYQININAVHLSRGKTNLIGVVLPYFDHPFFSQILKGISNQAIINNYKLVLFQTDYKVNREIEALHMLKQKQIDALIICSRTSDLSIIEEHLPFGPIVLSEDNQSVNCSTTFVNHYKAFYKALEYLYEKGHRKIGYCIGRKSGANSSMRNLAYKTFHEKYNLPYRPEFVIDKTLYFEDGEKVVDRVNKMKNPPTALLVTSDQVAAGIVITCQKRAISIPEDIAIIGFNNEPIAKMMNITSIEIPLLEIGKSLFLQAIDDAISSKEIDVKLIERGTV